MESSDSEDDQLPAILNRPKVANYVVQERVTVDTRDHEDHTFCGVMFDVTCKETLPVAFLEISSVAVRGDLGPMTVWWTPEGHNTDHSNTKLHDQTQWKQVYSKTHEPSPETLVVLELQEPVRLVRGETVGVYVHSGLPGDEGIVYDEQRSRYTHDDNLFRIHPGLAHISNRPFGRTGLWGHPWRRAREFVGRVAVGVAWQLWNPEINHLFPQAFRSAVRCLFLCAGRPSSPLHRLSDVVLMYILNMCRWDWFGVDPPAAPVPARPPGQGRARSGVDEGLRLLGWRRPGRYDDVTSDEDASDSDSSP